MTERNRDKDELEQKGEQPKALARRDDEMMGEKGEDRQRLTQPEHQQGEKGEQKADMTGADKQQTQIECPQCHSHNIQRMNDEQGEKGEEIAPADGQKTIHCKCKDCGKQFDFDRQKQQDDKNT